MSKRKTLREAIAETKRMLNPKDRRQHLVAVNVEQLLEHLKSLPAEAKVYGTDSGNLVAWLPGNTLAEISLEGYS